MAAERRLETSRQVEEIAGTHKHLTFALHVEDRNGMPVRGEVCMQADRYRLREVLDHLLENAVNYSPPEGTIEVTIRPLGSTRMCHGICGSVGPRAVSGDAGCTSAEEELRDLHSRLLLHAFHDV